MYLRENVYIKNLQYEQEIAGIRTILIMNYSCCKYSVKAVLCA